MTLLWNRKVLCMLKVVYTQKGFLYGILWNTFTEESSTRFFILNISDSSYGYVWNMSVKGRGHCIGLIMIAVPISASNWGFKMGGSWMTVWSHILFLPRPPADIYHTAQLQDEQELTNDSAKFKRPFLQYMFKYENFLSGCTHTGKTEL